MATVVFHVPDLSCEHCERTVKGVLAPLGGIRSVSVDIHAKQVRVTFDDTAVTPERMQEALRKEDYPVASADVAP